MIKKLPILISFGALLISVPAPALAAECVYLPSSCRISSVFGMRKHPVKGTMRPHKGIDMACQTGHPVKASMDGAVIHSGTITGGGLTVIVRSGRMETEYMHNSRNIAQIGDRVQTGQTIALVGSTGWSTGPHIHFGVKVAGRHVDPLSMLCTGAPPDVPTPPDQAGIVDKAPAYDWEVRTGLDGSFWDLLTSVMSSRALNPAYPGDLSTLSGTRLYQELNYLDGVSMKIADEKSKAKERLTRNQAIINTLTLEETRLPMINAQRSQAIKSAVQK